MSAKEVAEFLLERLAEDGERPTRKSAENEARLWLNLGDGLDVGLRIFAQAWADHPDYREEWRL